MPLFRRRQNIGAVLVQQLLDLLRGQADRFSRLLHVDFCLVPFCHILVSHEMLIDIRLFILLLTLTSILLLLRFNPRNRRSPRERDTKGRNPFMPCTIWPHSWCKLNPLVSMWENLDRLRGGGVDLVLNRTFFAVHGEGKNGRNILGVGLWKKKFWADWASLDSPTPPATLKVGLPWNKYPIERQLRCNRI